MKLRSLFVLVITVLCHFTLWAQQSKMSPYLRRMSMEYAQSARSRNSLSGTSPLRHTVALVRTTDSSVLKDNDCHILASWGDISAVSIPVPKLRTLASLPEVLRIEANEPCFLTNDTTASIVGVCSSPFVAEKVKDVRNTYGLTGKGVVIGVQDAGFDLTNPNYLSRDGQRYRVKAIWDQLDYSLNGAAVECTDGDSTYTLPGRQYTDEASILAKACTADSALETHGTHTSGTAAGSGLGGEFMKPLRWNFQYSGMAPEADLCLVNNAVGTNDDVIPEEHLDEYTTATDLLGFNYIFDYADRVGKPCVINFSEGAHQNLDDNELYNEVLETMVGRGRILCVSSGNEGTKGSYIHKEYGKEGTGAFLMSESTYAYYTMSSTAPVNYTLTFWKSATEKQQFTYDATSLSQYEDSLFTDTIQAFDSTYVVMMATYPSCYDSLKYATELLVKDLQNVNINQSKIHLSMTLNGKDNDIEVYESGGYFVKNNLDATLADFTKDHNILFPGSSPSVITVGFTAYCKPRENLYNNLTGVDFGVDGVVAEYSSKGPTMNGLVKPDVVAPGTNIVSANSSFNHTDLTNTESWVMNASQYGGRIYPWILNSGSSMSSPVVAGIIALWLEQCPTLSPDEIRDVFAHTCNRRDTYQDYPNNTWGYGEIDALAGLEYIMQEYTGIDDIVADGSKGRNSKVLEYDLMGRRITAGSGYHGIVISSDGSKTIRP